MALLFVAEKPSLGRAILAALPKPHKNHEGYCEAGNGDIVTWCIGHLLEQAAPEVYDEKYKKWRKEDLPIVPEKWILIPRKSVSKQLSVLKALLKKAEHIVHAGDPDREGQLLVDEVFEYAKLPLRKKHAIQRLLISDLNLHAVQKALTKLQSNLDFIPLSVSALGRARADWLYGINMTRLCTLQGQKMGYNGVLSIGRVQTPVLGLVVFRDLEIEHFVSKPFYEVIAKIKTQNDEVYEGKWKPSAACEPYMDEDKRVLSKALAENVIGRILGKKGQVSLVKENKKKQAPPLPYSLSALQIDASKRFGMSAQTVLDTCQQLYERHKLITYPRSDSRYLPKEQLHDANKVTQAISSSSAQLKEAVEKANLTLKSKAWNDAKVSAHHAIIPTSKSLNTHSLSSLEAHIYELVARQYLMQFYPDFEFMEKEINTEISGGLFISKQKEVRFEGWKALLGPKTTSMKSKDKKDLEDEGFSKIKLPNVQQGDEVDCIDAQLLEKQTSPPKYLTDASLLSSMTGIARSVKDPAIKKVLRETDGLGTEATRAGIIELLFKRQYLERKGKEIRATAIGRELITALPQQMVIPDMTAHWESQLTAISKKETKYNDFMRPLTQNIFQWVEEVQKVNFKGLQGKGVEKVPYKKTAKRKTKRS